MENTMENAMENIMQPDFLNIDLSDVFLAEDWKPNKEATSTKNINSLKLNNDNLLYTKEDSPQSNLDDNCLPWGEIEETAKYESYSEETAKYDQQLTNTDLELHFNWDIFDINSPESSVEAECHQFNWDIFDINSPESSVEAECHQPTPESQIDLCAAPKSKKIVHIENYSNKAKDGSYKVHNDILAVKPYDPAKKKNQIQFQTVDSFNHGEKLKIFMQIRKAGTLEADQCEDQNPFLDDTTLKALKKCECFSFHNTTPFCVKSDDFTIDWNLDTEMGGTHVALLTPTKEAKLKFAIRFLNANFKRDHLVLVIQHVRYDELIWEQKYLVKTGVYVTRTFKEYCFQVNQDFPYRDRGDNGNSVSEPKVRPEANLNKLPPPLKVEVPEKYLQALLDLLNETDSKYSMATVPRSGGTKRASSPYQAGGSGKRISK